MKLFYLLTYKPIINTPLLFIKYNCVYLIINMRVQGFLNLHLINKTTKIDILND